MSYHNIPIGKKAPEILNAVIEIPKGSHNKYEFDEELEVMKLDRVLHSPFFYATDYGFIPETRAKDGDHLDAMILTDSPVFCGCMMEIRPIGLFKMIDGGEEDHKILAVPHKNPHYKNIDDIKDIEPHVLKEIEHFFDQYKKLEDKTVQVLGWESKEKAIEMIKETMQAYKK
ncbi:MAG: Inorganic pyrophosphatase [Parcubacteria group bacterium GW2011_GWB1_42_6]|nr:MAG: Inorganic pyrophosphatase [Parcubacteria group bacterium GW2011_GWB1_42_6]